MTTWPKTLILAFICSGMVLCVMAQDLPTENDELTPAAARQALDEKRYARAQELYGRLLKRDGRSFENLMGRGLALFFQHEDANSQGLFIEASVLRPKDPQPKLYIALVEHRKGEDELARDGALAGATLADAVTFYREAAELMSDPYEPHYWAADVLLKLQRFDEAASELESALKARPNDPSARGLRSQALFLAGRYEECLPLLDAILVDAPESLPPQLRRLEVLARLGQAKEAMALIDSLTSANGHPGRSEPYDVLMRVWSDGKNAPRLLRAFEKISERQPNDALASFYRANAEALAGRHAAAARSFRKFLDRHPDSAVGRRLLSQVLLLAGDTVGAHREVRRACELAPEDLAVRDQARGVVKAYVDNRDFASAASLHALVVSLAPEDQNIALDQAILLKDQGRLDEAARIITRLCADEDTEIEDRARYLNELGLCLKGMRKLEEAEKRFTEAFENWSLQIDARENLAVMKFEESQLDRAEVLFREVLERAAKPAQVNQVPRYRSRYYLGLIRTLRRNR